MLSRRIAWIIIILVCGTMYFFSNETATLAVLAVCVLTPLFSSCLLIASGRSLRITVECMSGVTGELGGEHDAAGKIVLKAENDGILPLAVLLADISCKNQRTGESTNINCRFDAPGRSFKEFGFDGRFDHAGRYCVKIDKLTACDPLMLFKKRIAAGQIQFFTRLPESFDIAVTLGESSSAFTDSDRYADSRSGNDPGEVRSIREYVAGDPVKNIHWKLSEKMDKLLFKELGLPVTDDILAVLDTSSIQKTTVDGADAIASVFLSLLRSLRKDGYGFSVSWPAADGGSCGIKKIDSEEDERAAADEFLSVPADSESIAGSLANLLRDNRFAHIVIVGPEIPAIAGEITAGSRITALTPGAGQSRSQSGDLAVTGFDEMTPENDMAVLEI